jgi:hypothetical protein
MSQFVTETLWQLAMHDDRKNHQQQNKNNNNNNRSSSNNNNSTRSSNTTINQKERDREARLVEWTNERKRLQQQAPTNDALSQRVLGNRGRNPNSFSKEQQRSFEYHHLLHCVFDCVFVYVAVCWITDACFCEKKSF